MLFFSPEAVSHLQNDQVITDSNQFLKNPSILGSVLKPCRPAHFIVWFFCALCFIDHCLFNSQSAQRLSSHCKHLLGCDIITNDFLVTCTVFRYHWGLLASLFWHNFTHENLTLEQKNRNLEDINLLRYHVVWLNLYYCQIIFSAIYVCLFL